MRRKIGCVLLLLIFLLCGCSNSDDSHEYLVYYMNMDYTKIIPAAYEPVAEETEALALELMGAMKEEPESAELRQTIPNSVEILGCKQSAYMLTVDFNDAYYDMRASEEVLVRAAIVRTLTQLEGISFVSFTVDSQPLVYKNGGLVGSMGADSFVENPGGQINSSLQTTLTLYFANGDGTELEREMREVHYSSNISLEKLIMEQLIEGPKTAGLQAVIPGGTKLVTVSVVDGVCYVNLDETFRNQNSEISEQIVLYSIVDSLAELPEVDKVQISINGDTKGKVRFAYDLSAMYEPDYSYVETEGEVETE